MAKNHPCGDLFMSIGDEIYKSTVFNRFFEKNDPIVMGWAENVLAKLTAEGILPAFLQKKDNEDFKTYWGTIAHIFALTVIYARKYKEIDSNKILFETFIQNKGLTTDLVDSQEQMEYLFYNYLTEYSKRGRLDIISTEGSILGELLRLIRYNSTDEFIFALLQPQDTGWVMGSSSPSWKRTNTIENINKAYEFSESITDLSRYPLLRSANVQIVRDKNVDNKAIQVISFAGNQTVGIQGASDQRDKYIVVDPSISYEISLKIKVNGLSNQNLKFGATSYDVNFNQINFSVLSGAEYQSESNWFHSNDFLVIQKENLYYEIKGIILANNQRYFNAPPLNFLSGRALSMKASVKYICPVFIQERSAATDPLVYLYDLKVKPLNLPFEQGYLGARDIIASYYKNNAFQKESTLNLFLNKYLLSYKNIFSGQIFSPLEQASVIFKVFSNRNQYLDRATITINGQSYITNANGEAQVKLYPGSYLYNISAEHFSNIEGAVLDVDNQSKSEYIQMQGVAYQRSVVFSVRSNNLPLEGAKVTFNGQIEFTGTSGLAFFKAFPGIYEYKVEKTDFATISRNVSITDDTTIDVDLQAIPYYKVSFRVRDTDLPVVGAAVILTGDFDGDGTVTEQTGSTNALGIATGFIMRAGTYQYRISKDTYITKTGDFSIVGEATIEVALTPVPKYDITFNIKSNALPIIGAVVTFNGVQKTTDTYGKVVFREPNGEYNYSVTKKEFLTQSGAITVNNDNVTKNIEFIQIGYVVKFVVKSKGVPLIGAKVTIGTETISTNSSGEAEFLRVSGSYNWSITFGGYYQETGVVLVNGESKTVDVEMVLITYNIVFTVRINGQTVPSQDVRCGSDTYLTDAQGVATFNLPPGSWSWAVTRLNYDPQSGTALLVDRDIAVNVDLAATKGTMIFIAKDSVTSALLNNVAISVNGETKYTALTGQVAFTLPVGNYNFVSALSGYNSNSGTFTIVEGSSNKEILMVKEAAKVWSLTFTAKEGTSLLSGVNISLSNGLTGITNASGQAIFSIISGSYTYKATYNSFFPQVDGAVTVSEANTTASLAFVRKTTTVSFNIKDSISSQPVNGVSVEFNGSTKSTNTLGEVSFTSVPLSSSSLRYLVSKNPPYQDLIGTLVVNSENPKVNLKIGQYTYGISFTVKTNTGKPIAGAVCNINGNTGTTNSAGQVTIYSYINGTYSYTVTHPSYQTVTGTTTVTNAIAYPNVIMIPLSNIIKYHMQFANGVPVSGISININNNTIATDSNGDAIFSLKSGSYTCKIGEGSDYININESLIVADLDQNITRILEDVFVLKFLLPANYGLRLPILNVASQGLAQIKVDWGDGSITTGEIEHVYTGAETYRNIKISPGASGGTLQWSYGVANNATATDGARFMREVVRWFQQVGNIYLQYSAFQECLNLQKVASIVGERMEGSLNGIFRSCGSLTALPAGFFKWKHDSNLTNAFNGAGLSGNISQSFFEGISEVKGFESAFDGTNITTFTANIPGNRAISAANAFTSCFRMTSCNAFDKSTAINNLNETFFNCTSLTQFPSLVQIKGSVSMRGTFRNCSKLPALTINNYLPRFATDCSYIFAGCLKITSFAPGLITSTVTSLEKAFQGCISLASIEGTDPIDRSTSVCTSFDYAYEGCVSIVRIPQFFFNNLSRVKSFKYTFKDCKGLLTIGDGVYSHPEIFSGCRPTSMEGCFYNCVNLTQKAYGLQALFCPLDSEISAPVCVLRFCTNYSDCFSGVSKVIDFPMINSSRTRRELYQCSGLGVYNDSGTYRFTIPVLTGARCFRGCTQYFVGLANIPDNWK